MVNERYHKKSEWAGAYCITESSTGEGDRYFWYMSDTADCGNAAKLLASRPIAVKENYTHNGQLAGNPGINSVAFLPSLVMHSWVAGLGSPSPTPPSPELNIRDTPRTPKKAGLLARMGYAR